MEATGMEHFNGLPTPTKVESPLEKDDNGPEANRDWTNSSYSIIEMMLYMTSNTIPDISFAVY